uniref:Uncharacterized protein n=1 Tax=Zea mays TaxID=4577 RepID=A0A804LRV4_MAIZE
MLWKRNGSSKVRNGRGKRPDPPELSRRTLVPASAYPKKVGGSVGTTSRSTMTRCTDTWRCPATSSSQNAWLPTRGAANVTALTAATTPSAAAGAAASHAASRASAPPRLCPVAVTRIFSPGCLLLTYVTSRVSSASTWVRALVRMAQASQLDVYRLSKPLSTRTVPACCSPWIGTRTACRSLSSSSSADVPRHTTAMSRYPTRSRSASVARATYPIQCCSCWQPSSSFPSFTPSPAKMLTVA